MFTESKYKLESMGNWSHFKFTISQFVFFSLHTRFGQEYLLILKEKYE